MFYTSALASEPLRSSLHLTNYDMVSSESGEDIAGVSRDLIPTHRFDSLLTSTLSCLIQPIN